MVIVLTHTIASAVLYIRNPNDFAVKRIPVSEKSGNSLSPFSSYKQFIGSSNVSIEEAYLPLLEAKTIPELRLAIRNALSSIVSQLDNVVVYLKNPLSGIVEADGSKTLPSDGLLWNAYHQEDNRVTECPSPLLDPLADCLALSDEDQNTHSVICIPIPGRTDEGSVGIIAASFETGLTVYANDSRFEYLKKQTSVCYQLIKSSTAIRRKSVCETDSHIESLIGLCGELYDQDAASLQIKVIKYLQQRTQAQNAFLLLVVPDTQELFCQVVGSKVLQGEIRFPGQSSCFASALNKKSSITLDDLPEDNRQELYDICGNNVNSFLCVPVRRKGAEDLIALACVVNKRGAERFCGEDVQAIRKCFQYTATVLTSTLAFQNERKLKNQTQALLHVARKLFTRLGEYLYVYSISRLDSPVVRCGLYTMNIETLRPTFMPFSIPRKLEDVQEVQYAKSPARVYCKRKRLSNKRKRRSSFSMTPFKPKTDSIKKALTSTVNKEDFRLDNFGFMSPKWIRQPSDSSFNQGFAFNLPDYSDNDDTPNASIISGTGTSSYVGTMYTPRSPQSTASRRDEFFTPLSMNFPPRPRSLTPNSMYFPALDDSEVESITNNVASKAVTEDDSDKGYTELPWSPGRSLTPNSMCFNTPKPVKEDSDEEYYQGRSLTPNSMCFNAPKSVTEKEISEDSDKDYTELPGFSGRSLTPNSMYYNAPKPVTEEEVDEDSDKGFTELPAGRSLTPNSMYYNATKSVKEEVDEDSDKGYTELPAGRCLTPNSMYYNAPKSVQEEVDEDSDKGYTELPSSPGRSLTPNSMYFNTIEESDRSVSPTSEYYYHSEDTDSNFYTYDDIRRSPFKPHSRAVPLSGKQSRSDTFLRGNELPDVVSAHPSAQTSFSEPFIYQNISSVSKLDTDDSSLIFGFLESQVEAAARSELEETLTGSVSEDQIIFVEDTDTSFYHKLVLKDVKSWTQLSSHPDQRFRSQNEYTRYLLKNQVPSVSVNPMVENDLTKLLREIMQEARNLTQAERCSVFLIDDDELVAKVFDGISASTTQDQQEIILPKTQGIAGHVATSGQLLNIKDAYSHPLFYRGIDDSTGFRTRNILCFPIKNEDEVVLGVAQLCNKKTGPCFTQFDEDIASAFAVYCCISISHSLMYQKMIDAQSRNSLINELMMYHMKCLMYRKAQDAHHRSRLSNELVIYHMKVTDDEVTILDDDFTPVLQIHPDFDRFSYAPRILIEDETTRACLSMFEDLGFVSKWRIKRDCLIRFTLMVKRGYRNPPYHNWMHAYSVAHFCYLMIKNLELEKILGDIQVFALFVSCLCHDIDHRGTTNSFQVESQSVLAALYSSEGSVMERHHFAQSMCILNTEGCNIFENLSSSHYTQVLDLMRDIILATDLAHHLRILKSLKEIANNGYRKDSNRDIKLLLCLSMTACDLSDQTKNWNNTKKIASLVYQEFFSQGDLEKALGQNPLEMMDRDRACIPDLQISFLDNIALPVYEILAKIFLPMDEVLRNVLDNRSRWERIGKLLNLRRGNSTQQLSIEQIIALDLDTDDTDIEVLNRANALNGR